MVCGHLGDSLCNMSIETSPASGNNVVIKIYFHMFVGNCASWK